LIAEGQLEAQGDWAKGWKEVTIKLAGSTEKEEVEETVTAR
jgi:hypothetical protein